MSSTDEISGTTTSLSDDERKKTSPSSSSSSSSFGGKQTRLTEPNLLNRQNIVALSDHYDGDDEPQSATSLALLRCFNAVIQMIYGVRDLREYILANGECGEMHRSLRDLFQRMNNASCASTKKHGSDDDNNNNNISSNQTATRICSAVECLAILLKRKNIEKKLEKLSEKIAEPITTTTVHELMYAIGEALFRESKAIENNNDQKVEDQEKKVSKTESKDTINDAFGAATWSAHIRCEQNSRLAQLLQCQVYSCLVCDVCGNRRESWTFPWFLTIANVPKCPKHDDNVHDHQADNHEKNFLQFFSTASSSPSVIIEKNCGCIANSDCRTWSNAIGLDGRLCRAPPCLLVCVSPSSSSSSSRTSTSSIDLDFLLNERVIDLCGNKYELRSAILCIGDETESHSIHYWTLINTYERVWALIGDQKANQNIDEAEMAQLLSRYACMLCFEMVSVKAPHRFDPIKDNSNHKNVSTIVQTAIVANSSNTYSYCGLRNLGLTCYINSCLQLLYSMSRIRRYLIENGQNGLFHRVLSTLFVIMNDPKCDLQDPTLFVQQFRERKPTFRPNETADAQEFFTILLEAIHQEANKAKRTNGTSRGSPKSASEAWQQHLCEIDDSYLSTLFVGQVESTLMCDTCSNRSLSWSCIWQLQLHIILTAANANQELSLNDCIAQYFAAEHLADDCSPWCERCKSRQPATKSTTICRAPYYLVIHLERFTWNGRKIYNRISIPKRLPAALFGGREYVINGAVLHRGTESFGHNYTLFRERENCWIVLDDEAVTRAIDDNRAFDQLNSSAYLCVYRTILALRDGSGGGGGGQNAGQ